MLQSKEKIFGWVWVLFITSYSLLLSSCSIKNREQLHIIESNRALPPKWSEDSPLRLKKNGEYYYVVYVRDELKDLQLGIVQAEKAAYFAVRWKIFQNIIKTIKDRLVVNNKIVDFQSNWHQISDIYYIAYKKDNNLRYKVKIMIKFSVESFKNFTQELSFKVDINSLFQLPEKHTFSASVDDFNIK